MRAGVLRPLVYISDKNAKKWTRQSPSFPTDERGRELIPFGDIRCSKDGRLSVSAYSTHYSPNKVNDDKTWTSYLLVSTDHGKSWQIKSTISRGGNETTIIEVRPKEWFAAVRKGSCIGYQSLDHGETWKSVGSITKKNEIPGHLFKHSNGQLIFTYGDRDGKNKDGMGVKAKTSLDGKNWSTEVFLDKMENRDGGYPATAEGKDGELLTIFYKAMGKKGFGDQYEIRGVYWK
jgi:hypothetical protein